MREKLNENPVAQIALLGLLALVAGYFVISSLSGGESEEGEGSAPVAAESEAPAAGAGAPEAEAPAGIESSSPAAAASSVAAPSTGELPAEVEAAYESGETVVLLIFRPDGIDDKRVAEAVDVVTQMPNVALFEAPVGEVARYSAITGPLGVSQAPALIVIRSRDLNNGGDAPATVTYGFQNADDIRQAVIDAGYRGPELPYAPN